MCSLGSSDDANGTSASAPLLEVKELCKVYEAAQPVYALRSVNFTINQGEFVAVVGSSGSGKSTLLNILGLLDEPTSGEYILDGVKIGELKAYEKAQLRGSQLGFVFQSFHLIQGKTVLENVAVAGMYIGKRRVARFADAEAAIEKVGLEHRKDFLPAKLSGGEKQRVAIARALANDPKILLCDEPTGNLDSKTAAEIEAILRELNANGYTVIVVTHNDALASRADRIIRVSDGEVVEEE